jgi:hypothetical protein
MKITYQNYWASRKLLHSEEATVSYLDTCNKTRYLKSYKKNKITLEEISRKNHYDGLMYVVSILDDTNFPIIFLEIVHENEHIGVHFIDNFGRDYLTYHFDEIELKNKLFLRELWYKVYSNNETNDMDCYFHFVFDTDGNISYRKYDELEKKTMDYESKNKFNIDELYEDYPDFGNYEKIIKFERNIDILKNIIGK